MALQRLRQADSPWSWLVCCSATFAYGLALGSMLSYGVLFPVLMDHFRESLGKTALVGSFGISMIFTASPLAGMLLQRRGCRFTAMTGASSCVLGILLSSFAQDISVLYLTYSLMCGIGVSCIYMSCYMVIAKYFEKRLLLATGVVTSGGALGVLVIAPVFQTMLEYFGWRNTYRVLAGGFASILLAATVFTEPATEIADSLRGQKDGRAKEDLEQSEKMLDLSVCKVPQFVVFAISVAVHCFGLYIPQIHLVKYCESLKIPSSRASSLFVFHGIGSLIGRIISGRLCDMPRINKTRLYQFTGLLPAVATLALPMCRSYNHLLVFICCYGFGEGMFITMTVVVLMHGMDHKQRSSSLGIGTMCYGLTSALGPPTAGFIADSTGSYVLSFYMAGGIMFLAVMLPFLHYFISKEGHIDYKEKLHEIALDFSSSNYENCYLILERETVL